MVQVSNLKNKCQVGFKSEMIREKSFSDVKKLLGI
jgi:hypothetical protein